jgi:hypothetical protein
MSFTALGSSLFQRSQTENKNNKTMENARSHRYLYRTCPICNERLLVRINGSFVYKWVSNHFSVHHHEWMHVVVNLHESI